MIHVLSPTSRVFSKMSPYNPFDTTTAQAGRPGVVGGIDRYKSPSLAFRLGSSHRWFNLKKSLISSCRPLASRIVLPYGTFPLLHHNLSILVTPNSVSGEGVT